MDLFFSGATCQQASKSRSIHSDGSLLPGDFHPRNSSRSWKLLSVEPAKLILLWHYSFRWNLLLMGLFRRSRDSVFQTTLHFGTKSTLLLDELAFGGVLLWANCLSASFLLSQHLRFLLCFPPLVVDFFDIDSIVRKICRSPS